MKPSFFKNLIESDIRKLVFIGESGCGKSEMALNFALSIVKVVSQELDVRHVIPHGLVAVPTSTFRCDRIAAVIATGRSIAWITVTGKHKGSSTIHGKKLGGSTFGASPQEPNDHMGTGKQQEHRTGYDL